MTDTISNEELLARYEALCAASDRHANDGWRSSHEDGLKRSLTITAAQLDHFADMVIGGIGFEPIKDFQGAEAALSGPVTEFTGFTQEQSDSYARDLQELLEKAERQLAQNPTVHPEEWLKTARHDGVVGGVKAQVNLFGRQVPVSLHTVRTSMRAFRMRRMLGHVPRCVLEIGGGHGKFVRDVLMIAPQTRIVYCDLVFNLLLAGRYLTRMFGDAVHLAWDDAEPIPSEAKILLLPPWRISEIPYQIDLCCNFMSFQHMEPGNVRYYGDVLERLDVPAIFHYNRMEGIYAREVSLADGAFGPTWNPIIRTPVQTATVIRESGTKTLAVYEELSVLDRHRERFIAAGRERLSHEKQFLELQELRKLRQGAGVAQNEVAG